MLTYFGNDDDERDPFGRIRGNVYDDRPDISGKTGLNRSVGTEGKNDRDDVALTETLLGKSGFLDLKKTRGPTGYWGMRTDQATKAFQKANGLKVDGLVNPRGPTIQKLSQVAKKQSVQGGHPEPARTGIWPGAGPSAHHGRNRNQTCPSSSPDSNNPNWHSYGPSSQHCGYNDYRGRTGGPNSGYQCVYDNDGSLVTDPACRGTYDYVAPYDSQNGYAYGVRPVGHFFADVLPWYLFGN